MCLDTRVSSGEGKGWAKGRTAASDPRIARNASAHRGLTYERHIAFGDDRRIRSTRRLPLQWSDAMAYVVGLTATDGCLLSGRRKINFKSADRELVASYVALLGSDAAIRSQTTRVGGVAYFVEFGDRQFYDWLVSVGLMPRKSLLLGAISVPEEYLLSLVRGLFDGDGHLANFTHHPTLRSAPEYRYERLWTFFNSASRPHLEWLQGRLATKVDIRGLIETQRRPAPRHTFFRLKYGNRESAVLLKAMYPNEDVPRLRRKWMIWVEYARRRGSV